MRSALLMSLLLLGAAIVSAASINSTTAAKSSSPSPSSSSLPLPLPSPSPSPSPTSTAAPSLPPPSSSSPSTTATTTHLPKPSQVTSTSVRPSGSPAPSPPSPSPPPPPRPPAPTPGQDVDALKSGIIAGGWIPFVVALGISIIFSWSLVRTYQHTREKELGSTIVVILSIVVALLTSSLVPVDIFLVSSFKSEDGSFHGWALSHQDTVGDTMQYAYYAMYALIIFFVFIVIPMAYFYFEAKDEEEGTKCGSRMMTGVKFTVGLLIVMAVLMCIGAFAISSEGTSCPDNLNGTDIKEYAKCRADFAEKALTENGGNNAISFTIGALTTVGVFYFMFYTATGLVALPLDMIRSRFKRNDNDDTEAQLTNIRERQDAIRRKAQTRKKGRGGGSMSTADRRNLERLQHEERVMSQATRRADKLQNNLCTKISIIFRPFEFVFGIAFFILSLFLVASLALSSGDKLLQITQQKLNWKTGYSEAAPKVANPIDLAMNTFQKAFPVDYVLLTLIIYYLLSATMHGVRYLGVRFCGLKVFNIRRQRTVPQALLFMATIIMFTLLFINVVLLTLAPQYVTYGNQHYSNIDVYSGKGCHNAASFPTKDVKLCTTEAPDYVYLVYQGNNTHPHQFDAPVYNASAKNGCVHKSFDICTAKNSTQTWNLSTNEFACTRQKACVSTRFAAILHAFFYNIWFFGAIYYWANWGFILIYFIALFYLTCKRRRSLVASLINDAKHDFDDSDDDMTPFNPKWAK